MRLILSTSLLCLSAAAHAEIPTAVYVGAFGGLNGVLNEWDLYFEGDGGKAPNTGALVGLRIGAHVIPHLSIEGSLGIAPYNSDADEGNVALSYGLDALIHITRGKWVPFVDVGGGAYHNVSGDHGVDVDYQLHYGVGLRGMLTDWLALRVDARHVLTDSYDPSSTAVASNLEFGVGLDLFMTGGTRVVEVEKVIEVEKRVEVPVERIIEKVVEVPVPVEGPAGETQVVRETVVVPAAAPMAAPEVPPGGMDMGAILFASGSSKLSPKAQAKLDLVADMMRSNTDVVMVVAGHTDAKGDPEANAKLSKSRADAVRAYLVGKGIANDRLLEEAFGAAQPVKPNDTEEGRAMNRRAHLRITSK